MRNKIIICDESDIIASGLKKIAEGIRLNVVAHVRNQELLIDKIKKTDAQIVIINLSILGQFRNEFMQNISRDFPELEVIALVSSYIDKKITAQYDYVINLNDGQEEIETLLQKAANDKKSKTNDSNLSKREKDILVAVAKGLTNKEISDELNISIHTVISHRKNITKKTGIRSVSGFTVYALLNNLIEESDVQK